MQDIFVFGSNTAGRHGAGAALTAKLSWGAVQGVGFGRTGNSYAIPTKESAGRALVSMDVKAIRVGVEHFFDYAEEHPHLRFLVTAVGCGLAGFRPSEMAPLFVRGLALDNVLLPAQFLSHYYRLSVDPHKVSYLVDSSRPVL